MVFVVRRVVLDALLADSQWTKRLASAKSSVEVERVVSEFTRARGFVVVEVPASRI